MSSTKTDTSVALGIDGFAALASSKPCPVVTISSIKTPIVAQLIQSGADGVAVVSAICGQKDPGATTKALAEAVALARS